MSNPGGPTASTSNDANAGQQQQGAAPPTSAATPAPAAQATTPANQNEIVMNFLARKGFMRTHQMLQEELKESAAAVKAGMSTEEFFAKNRRPRVVEAPAWKAGFAGLCRFVQGSLALHRNELQQMLWPIFVHIYLDLVKAAEPTLATEVHQEFGNEFKFQHPDVLRTLGAIKLEDHINQDPMMARWRKERYHVPLTERGWGLLQGWLQGGGLLDAAGQTKGTGDKGRDHILAIINERIELKIAPAHQRDVLSRGLIGLQSDLGLSSRNEPPSEPLKLGQPPRDQRLEKDMQRELRDHGEDPTLPPPPGAVGSSAGQNGNDEALEVPSQSLPYPGGFRVIDVKREVERVREARKRIRLGPEAFQADGSLDTKEAQKQLLHAAKPSVCLFTVHDAAQTMTSSLFSQDATILANGFSDSSIRMWKLNNENFKAMSSDFDAEDVRSTSDLKDLKVEDRGPMVKLIGHSGPVYSLAFDPTTGPSAPPNLLLSASQDATVRLWSMDTLSNLVAYRAHRDPIWDVDWAPRGVYFATGSRDRTARLWSTERTAPLRMMVGHLSDVDCVRFHPNALYLATGSQDRTARLWDVQKGTCVRVFSGHTGGLSTLAISPDGRQLATAADDATVKLWDMGSGKLIKSMSGHTARINSLAWSMESAVLLSASNDCTIRMWDTQSTRTASDATLSGSELKNLGLSAESFSGLKSASALSLSTSGLAKDAAGQSSATLSVLPRSAFAEEDPNQSPDLLGVLLSKRTPLHHVQVTERNLALAVGPMQQPQQQHV